MKKSFDQCIKNVCDERKIFHYLKYRLYLRLEDRRYLHYYKTKNCSYTRFEMLKSTVTAVYQVAFVLAQ